MIYINILLGLLFGLMGTSVLHLAKAMERHGIEIFDRKKKEKGKKPIIYIIGFILNNTIFIYQLAGTYFASAGVYSSVFGFGLIVLLIYSVRILKEEMTIWSWIGSGTIISGTVLVGFCWLTRGSDLIPSNVNWDVFFILMIITAIILPIMLIYARLIDKRSIIISLLFGFVGGTCGALDIIWKSVGFVGGNFYIWILSFAIGGGAFLITQWGFANKADASKLVPCFNSAYIIVPVLYEAWIIPSASTQIHPLQVAAIIIIVFGIFSMTAIKAWRTGDRNK